MISYETIITERLELAALTPRLMGLWVTDLPQLEKELNCSYQGEPMEGSFFNIVKGQLKITEMDPDNYLWHSFWLLIRRCDRVVVGSADFKDLPDEKGHTEIGYGLAAQFRHKGYMTEAVAAMCDWALKQDGVSHVIAETDQENLPSQRILKRCGFERYGNTEKMWWIL